VNTSGAQVPLATQWNPQVTSLHNHLLIFLLRLMNRKAALAALLSSDALLAQDRLRGPDRPTAKMKQRIDVSVEPLNGFELYTLKPKNARPGRHVLYLHGGAYVRSITKYHWRLLQQLVEEQGCTFSVPLYPLAPEYTSTHAVPLALAAYALARERSPSQAVVVMGDSAGAGLALALCFALRDLERVLPDQLILICPWVDVEMENPAIAATEPLDPMLSRHSLATAGSLYGAGLPLSHPWTSPLQGDFTGLPDTTLFAATRDIVSHDSLALAAAARAQGVNVTVRIGEGMIHVWPLLPIPEGRAARAEIAQLLRFTP
jgi:acetyl esterase/lipase